MSRLTRDGTAETVSRGQILRHERGQGDIHFPCSADHEQDWQPCPVDPYSAICVTKFSGTNEGRGIFIFPVQLTTSRIGNLTRLIHTLAICVTIHTSWEDPYYIAEKSYATLQAISPTNIKTVHQISLLHNIESTLDRLGIKKNLNTSRRFEHPSVRAKKLSKRLEWIIGVKYKASSYCCHLPD